jgi:WD40 repeat protein
MTSPTSNLPDLVDDCERFLLWFFDPIEASALHIYHSALPWSPTSSLTRGVYQNELTPEVKLMNAVDATWDTRTRTIPVHDDVDRVVFSQTGTLIAALGNNRIRIFNVTTGASIATFDEQQPVETVAFSHDDTFLVSALSDGTVRVLEVQTGNLVHTFRGHPDAVTSVAFSPSGAMIASGSRDSTIRVWDTSSGCCEYSLEGHLAEVWAVCWYGTENEVISGSADGAVLIWDLSTRTHSYLIHVHTNMVTSVAFSQDFVASGSCDGEVSIYDSHSGNLLHTIPTNDRIVSVQFSARGDKMMYAYQNSASIWDLGKNKCVSTIKHDGYNAKFSPDGMYVASHLGKFVKVWGIENGRSSPIAVDQHSGPVVQVSIASDGRLVKSESNEDVKIWDATSGKCLFTSDSTRYSTRFSLDFALAASVPDLLHDPPLKWSILNVRTGRLIKKMDYLCTRLVALSSDGTRMASFSHVGIELWSLVTGKRLAQLELDHQWKSDIAFNVDGSSILITAGDGSTKSWRITPTPPPDQRSSSSKTSASLPMVLVPMHPGQDASAPLICQSYDYNIGDEWIVGQDGARVLWVPPDRRGCSIVHGKKVAIGTRGGRVYMVDFSSALKSP